MKIMKTTLLTLIASAMLNPLFAADQYAIDGSHTSIYFSINHMGFSNTQGRFNDISGSGSWDNDNPKNNSIDFTIKTASIDTADAKRDKHLRKADFFDAAQFPVITFKSTAVVSTGDNAFNVTGNLSMHGVTKEIVIPLVKIGEGDNPWGQHVIGFSADFIVDRMDFGINYMPDKLGHDVNLHLALEGNRK